MLYNKNNLAVSKFASKSSFRPAISGVFFTKDKTVATDSFRLVEMSVPKDVRITEFPSVDGKKAMRGMKPVIINAEYLKKNVKLVDNTKGGYLKETSCMAISHVDSNKVEVLTVDKDLRGEPRWLPRISSEQFPDYERIFPTKKPKAEISINGLWLAEILELLGKMNGLNAVKIKVYEHNEPIVIEAKSDSQTARAMLMPLKS